MPNWNGLILTKRGRTLQAKVEAGAILELTKIKLGSGSISEHQTLEDLTDLVEPKQILGIATKEVQENGLCKISSTISNVNLEVGYYVKELGVFAKDPDDGEILYAITTDTAPDYLPAQGGSLAISQEFAIYVAISNASNVTAVIDPGAIATMGYVLQMIKEHDTSENAHATLFIPNEVIDSILGQTGGGDYVPSPGLSAEEITNEDIDALFKEKIRKLLMK